MISRLITDTRLSVYLFLLALLFVYAFQPWVANYFVEPNPYFSELATIVLVGCAALYLGYLLPLFDFQFRPRAFHVLIDAKLFHAVVWSSFVLFLIVTFATAQNIPILSALQGASIRELDLQRGEFFKGRIGDEIILLYLSTLFVSALLPYSLVGLFQEKSPMRFVCLGIFLLLCVSFLNKALFINVAFPMMYFLARQKTFSVVRIGIAILASFALLYILTLLAYSGGSTFVDAPQTQGFAEFFGPHYKPAGAIDFLIWRSLSVPMFTASDALLVFQEQFGGEPLLGATSSSISMLFGLDRIPFERLVFEHQYGGWNEIANSNSVFLADAYINFGWTGVIIFSLIVGQSMRWFSKSRDHGIRALWMIWCFGLFNGSLIGMLLSNGYILIFFMALFVRLFPYRPGRQTVAVTG
jgi:O-antigen polysaccharide polymerase Wzy